MKTKLNVLTIGVLLTGAAVRAEAITHWKDIALPLLRTAPSGIKNGLRFLCRRTYWSILFSILWAFLSSSITLNAAQSGDFTYEIAGSTITLTGYTGPGGNVIIPGTLAGMPVIIIAAHAFSGATGLTSVTIPNGVTSIEDYAFFFCTGLSSVTIPNSVTSIGEFAFIGCTGLSTIAVDVLNPSYSSTDGVLFSKRQDILIQYPGGRVGRYTIPNSVTNIWDWAFQDCTGLTSVTIPNGVARIGDAAFRSCTGLTGVTIPNSVTSIGEFAFASCTELLAITVDTLNPSYTSTDGVLFSKRQDILIQCPGGREGSYTIPNSVTIIGSYAFYGCTGLTSVTIPNTVTDVGEFAFRGCTRLSAITVDTLNPSYFSTDGVLFSERQEPFGKPSIFLIEYPGGRVGSYTIPNGVTMIVNKAFFLCTGLTSVTIPNSVTTIGEEAFSGCTGLTSVYFKGNAPAILGGGEFSGADKAIVYYLAGTTGWTTTYGGRPTAVWVDQPSYSEWSQSFGLATKYPNASGEQDDADADGLKNIQEMAAGTDPTDANSALIIEQQPRPNDLIDGDKAPIGPDQFALHFQTIPGKTYQIQSTEMVGIPWKTEATVTATTTQKRILISKPAHSGFYRVLLGQ